MKLKYEQIYTKLNYKFKNLELLQIALTHRSAARKNNERLEFLGDGVLNTIIGWQLYEFYPKADEGVLSRYRAALVKEQTLAETARMMDLGRYLILGPGELKSGGNQRDSILADGLEALIGAVYIDGGYDQSVLLVNQLFQDKLTKLADAVELKDPKTLLQEYLQSKRMPLPDYTLVEVGGEAHARHFIVECQIQALQQATQGEGSSRRRAEQAAAEMALTKLQDE